MKHKIFLSIIAIAAFFCVFFLVKDCLIKEITPEESKRLFQIAENYYTDKSSIPNDVTFKAIDDHIYLRTNNIIEVGQIEAYSNGQDIVIRKDPENWKAILIAFLLSLEFSFIIVLLVNSFLKKKLKTNKASK